MIAFLEHWLPVVDILICIGLFFVIMDLDGKIGKLEKEIEELKK